MRPWPGATMWNKCILSQPQSTFGFSTAKCAVVSMLMTTCCLGLATPTVTTCRRPSVFLPPNLATLFEKEHTYETSSGNQNRREEKDSLHPTVKRTTSSAETPPRRDFQKLSRALFPPPSRQRTAFYRRGLNRKKESERDLSEKSKWCEAVDLMSVPAAQRPPDVSCVRLLRKTGFPAETRRPCDCRQNQIK